MSSNTPFGKIWDKWGAELSVAFLLFLVWKLWPLLRGLSSVGDGIGGGLTSITADWQQSGKRATQRAAVRAWIANPSEQQLAKWESDADQLAALLGGKSLAGINYFTFGGHEGRKSAFQFVKQYSKRQTRIEKTGKVLDMGERKDWLQLKVLQPFYADSTDGRNLFADVDKVMRWFDDDMKAYYNKWIR